MLALLAFATAVAGEAMSAGLFHPKVGSLANGLRIVVIEDHRAPVVTHMVWYRVGAADEPPGKSGIAHFLEHLMFKGTTKVGSGGFSKIVARNGGRDNAFTSHDYTGYYQNVARDKLDLVMSLEADRMVNLRLDPEDVETEREVILEERRSRTDNKPSAQLSEAMHATQFMAHPYGIPVIGWQHEIEALSREDALAFYRTYYAPNNAILIVAGDVTAEQVMALAETHYGGIPRADTPARRRPQEPPQLAARRVELRDARVNQADLRRSYLAPSRSAGETRHAVPLSLFAEMLGGGTTSRLYQELVVKRKLAASAGAYYSATNLDRRTFSLYVTPSPGVTVTAAEQAMDEVLAAVLRDGFEAAELARSRTGMLAAAIYARDSLFTSPRIFGDALTSGLTVEQVEGWPDEVRAVTMEQVMAAGRAVLDPRRSVTGLLLPEG
ncbi:MAG: pitrilysin family protein [Alphaproteobacteria bacterium]|jgi:zinc protease|nr:pitrilysin family protein [Alphaproteobacteria bacterium]MDP6567249.1 pitrilysin family protein [Alphaproteobacteria bacterium]MDP6812923.1 pitrilysin family protein [Alphaproteobacteria bacterium]